VENNGDILSLINGLLGYGVFMLFLLFAYWLRKKAIDFFKDENEIEPWSSKNRVYIGNLIAVGIGSLGWPVSGAFFMMDPSSTANTVRVVLIMGTLAILTIAEIIEKHKANRGQQTMSLDAELGQDLGSSKSLNSIRVNNLTALGACIAMPM